MAKPKYNPPTNDEYVFNHDLSDEDEGQIKQQPQNVVNF